jgi:hypothetical protein
MPKQNKDEKNKDNNETSVADTPERNEDNA